jgi:2-phosphosulfolactate phosphatase
MIIDRCHPSRLGESLDVAVVFDVLRATSTATVLLGRGIDRLRVVATLDDLQRLPQQGHPYLLVSELKRAAELGERLDNSPTQARTVALEGRLPVLVTTNGTRALVAAAKRSRRVLLASFLNVSAVARHLRALQPERLTLVPAGDYVSGEPHTEDEECADALAALLRAEPAELAERAQRSRNDPRVQRRLAREAALASDLELCLTPDVYDVVLEFEPDDDAAGWIRRATT